MRYLLYFLSSILLISCGEKKEEQNLAVTGEAPGIFNGIRAYYNAMDARGGLTPLDTSIVVDEKFSFDVDEDFTSQELRLVTIDGVEDNLMILTNGDEIKLKIKKDSLPYSQVEGGAENEAMRTFQEEKTTFQNYLEAISEKRNTAMQNQDAARVNEIMRDYQTEFTEFQERFKKLHNENLDNLVGAMTLGELINMKAYNETAGRSQYNKLSKEVQSSPISQKIDDYLKQIEKVAIGAKAPQFEGFNPDGEVIKLNEVLGKITLIDFWASWCGPCRRENPNVVAAYEKYHDKGFNIISVSLDRKNGKQAWINAIEKDNMDWNHISRLSYFGPIAKDYNVNSIPATFLLDENGIIIDKNLRGEALHNRLEGLLASD